MFRRICQIQFIQYFSLFRPKDAIYFNAFSETYEIRSVARRKSVIDRTIQKKISSSLLRLTGDENLLVLPAIHSQSFSPPMFFTHRSRYSNHLSIPKTNPVGAKTQMRTIMREVVGVSRTSRGRVKTARPISTIARLWSPPRTVSPAHYNAIFFLCSFCVAAVLPLLVFRSGMRKSRNDRRIWALGKRRDASPRRTVITLNTPAKCDEPLEVLSTT